MPCAIIREGEFERHLIKRCPRLQRYILGARCECGRFQVNAFGAERLEHAFATEFYSNPFRGRSYTSILETIHAEVS